MARTLDPERAAAIGKVGGLITSSRHTPSDYTERARTAFLQSFENLVDPDGTLPEAERLRRAAAARRAHFVRLGLKSGEVRSARKGQRNAVAA